MSPVRSRRHGITTRCAGLHRRARPPPAIAARAASRAVRASRRATCASSAARCGPSPMSSRRKRHPPVTQQRARVEQRVEPLLLLEAGDAEEPQRRRGRTAAARRGRAPSGFRRTPCRRARAPTSGSRARSRSRAKLLTANTRAAWRSFQSSVAFRCRGVGRVDVVGVRGERERQAARRTPAIAAQSAVWLAKWAWSCSTPSRRSRHAAASAFGVTATSRSMRPQARARRSRCRPASVRSDAHRMTQAAPSPASPAVRASHSGAGSTALGPEARERPVPEAVLASPRTAAGRPRSWPASWTAIISFTTKGCEGSGGYAGMT